MEALLPMFGFIFAATITPGPNNFMVMISGANWGLARTLPHIAGITFGFPAMILAVGLGLDVVFEAVPQLRTVLKYVAFAYLLWLSWRIAIAGRPEIGSRRTGGPQARPMTFVEAVAFQWVNPKAWSVVLSGVTLFTAESDGKLVVIAAMATVGGLVCVPNGIAWTLFGTAISRLLSDDKRLRWFNISMAVLLVVSVLPTLL